MIKRGNLKGRLVQKTCVICNIDYEVSYYQREKYVTCSSYCSSLRSILIKNNGIYIQCDYCSKALYVSKGSINKKKYHFCNSDCDRNYRKYVTNIGNIKLRKTGKKYYGENWRKIAREVRHRDGNKCCDCGVDEFTYGKKMSVHHKIPFVYFDTYQSANKKDNLVSLCESCHRKRHSGKGHALKFDSSKFGKNYRSTYGQTKNKHLTDAKEIVFLLENTVKSLEEIARIVGVSTHTVRRIYNGDRWRDLYEKPIKYTKPRGKSGSVAMEIVNLLVSTDYTLKDIADTVGVGVSRVQDIYKGKTWVDLYDEPPYIKHPRSQSHRIKN